MTLRTAIATATTAAILATSGVALAGATTNSGSHSSTAATAATVSTSVRHPAARLRLRIRRGAAAVIMKTIGIDRQTLRADLAGGQTIAQIASAKGVAPQTVIDALVTAATNKLDAAVKAGKIKADRAAKIEQKLPDRAAKLVNTWHPKHLKTTAS